MRIDILPLCDKHYRTMAPAIAPFSADYSIDFFRCTAEFCGRCFSERLGYVTPKRNEPPIEQHWRPMFISSLYRQRNVIHYACPEENCRETGSESIGAGSQLGHRF